MHLEAQGRARIAQWAVRTTAPGGNAINNLYDANFPRGTQGVNDDTFACRMTAQPTIPMQDPIVLDFRATMERPCASRVRPPGVFGECDESPAMNRRLRL